jgi:hypothetical protein
VGFRIHGGRDMGIDNPKGVEYRRVQMGDFHLVRVAFVFAGERLSKKKRLESE